MLISIDTLRADRVGCYGAERAHTPGLDALARDGVRFDVALAPTPLTLPSHTSLMTALDPPRHGVRHNSVFRLASGIPTLAEQLQQRGLATAAFVGALVLDRRFGLDRGFDHYDDQMGARRSGKFVGFAERTADQVVDAALAWLETAPDRFFLWVHVYDPHADYLPPPGFAVAFPSPYDGEIAFVDAQLRRLIEALDARHPGEGTLVVATSDHGESLGEHGEPSHSYTIYDATQRIPLLLRGGGLPAGTVVDTPVRLVDVAPTILGLTGAAALPDVDGRDLRETLSGQAPRDAYLETLATRLDHGWSALLALRTPRYKYIRAPRPELYDLENDPRERRNRAELEPERVAELDARLERRLASSRAPEPAEALSAEDRAALESLGYVVPGPEALAGDLLGPGLDPKDGVRLLRILTQASGLADRGNPAEGYALLEAVEDDSPMLTRMRASLALHAADGVAAETAARRLVALDPRQTDAQLFLGHAFELQGREDEAREAYRAALALDAGAGRAELGLGRLAEAAGDEAGAIAAYTRARASRSPEAEATWRLAALHIEAERFAEAEALNAAMIDEGTHDDLASQIRLAVAELRVGRSAEAGERLVGVRHARPGSPEAARLLGDLLERTGHLVEALEVRERQLLLDPGDWQAANAVAWNLALLERDLDRALALARSAAEASDQQPAVLDTLATVHLARKEYAEAEPVVARALAVADSGALRGHLLYLRAAALAGRGRSGPARRALTEALAAAGADPAWRPAADRLARELGLALPKP